MQEKLVNSFNDSYTSEEQKLIDALLLVAPLIQKIMPLDCMLGLTDTQKFIKVFPGEKIKMDHDVTGTVVPKQDAIYNAMHENKAVNLIVPNEVFGFEFRSIAIPLKDGSGKIFGGLGIAFTLENSLKVSNMAKQVLDSTQQTSAVIQELTSSAEELVNLQSIVQNNAKTITDKIDNTNEILQFINSIAATSKMLGLNAAIEASRAGELGKGFSVVASEIRKMAEESSKSVVNIKEIIGEITDEIKQIKTNIDQIVTIGQQQAASSEEISASTQELTVIAEELKNASQKVIG